MRLQQLIRPAKDPHVQQIERWLKDIHDEETGLSDTKQRSRTAIKNDKPKQ